MEGRGASIERVLAGKNAREIAPVLLARNRVTKNERSGAPTELAEHHLFRVTGKAKILRQG